MGEPHVDGGASWWARPTSGHATLPGARGAPRSLPLREPHVSTPSALSPAVGAGCPGPKGFCTISHRITTGTSVGWVVQTLLRCYHGQLVHGKVISNFSWQSHSHHQLLPQS